MAERVIGLGDIGDHMPVDPWIVVFGGVTREGNRRARRAIRAALESGWSVVWFDGFSERWEDRKDSGRVTLDVPVPDETVIIIDYQEDEGRHWLTRLIDGMPWILVKPMEKAENLGVAPGSASVPVVTPLRRLVQRVLGLFHKKVLRRLFLIFRGVVGWRIVRDDVTLLASTRSRPRRIIYGDDFALTIAWHSARLWPEVSTAMELESQ